MNEQECREAIRKALENAGIFADCNENVNLEEYFESSIQFMTFIVNLEEEAEVEIPDELLVFESFKTVDEIINVLLSLKK